MIRQFLQRFRRPKGKPAPISMERVRFVIGGLVLLAVSFLLGFYLFFPENLLKARLAEELAIHSPMDIEVEEIALRFPPALMAREIYLTGKNRPPLHIAEAVLAPSWGTLFGSNPGLNFRSTVGGGRVQGTIRRNGLLEAEVSQVAFAEPLAADTTLALAGTIDKGQISAVVPQTANSDARLTVTLNQVRLTGLEGFGFPSGAALSLGTVVLQGSGKGNNYQIDQLESSGGDLEVSGGGSILLANTAERSRLNIALTLRPSATLDANLKEMLGLFAKPARDGSLRLRLTGSLASPSLQ